MNGWLRALLVLASAGFSAACGGKIELLPPLGQILLFVDTDAPIPAGPRSPPGDAPPWLFDRLRFEVLRGPNVVSELIPLADRDFSIDEGRFDDGPVSIGISPQVGDTDLVLRVQLFRSDHARNGKPSPNTVIESRVRLPPIEHEGIKRVFVSLRVDDTGIIKGAPDLLEPDPQVAETSLVGSWPGARVTDCPGSPREGEVCIPGGAFWMGDPALRGNADLLDADRERLVVVSPFFLDQREVTVGDFRVLAAQLEGEGWPLPSAWSGDESGLALDDFSTFSPAPHPSDPHDTRVNLPLNAVSWATARAYCQALGKELPTEAMFEFVASGRGREYPYVWGDDPPACDGAVIERAACC